MRICGNSAKGAPGRPSLAWGKSTESRLACGSFWAMSAKRRGQQREETAMPTALRRETVERRPAAHRRLRPLRWKRSDRHFFAVALRLILAGRCRNFQPFPKCLIAASRRIVWGLDFSSGLPTGLPVGTECNTKGKNVRSGVRKPPCATRPAEVRRPGIPLAPSRNRVTQEAARRYGRGRVRKAPRRSSARAEHFFLTNHS